MFQFDFWVTLSLAWQREKICSTQKAELRVKAAARVPLSAMKQGRQGAIHQEIAVRGWGDSLVGCSAGGSGVHR
jgi:hypothetical protein